MKNDVFNPTDIPNPLVETYNTNILLNDETEFKRLNPSHKLAKCDVWFDRPTFFICKLFSKKKQTFFFLIKDLLNSIN